MSPQLLIVAPTSQVRDQLHELAHQSGVSADVMSDFELALSSLQKDPPVLVLSENPPDDETMEKLRTALLRHAPVTPLLVALPERNSALAVKRMSEGAYDCLCPPFSPGDFLAAGKRAVSRVGRRLLTSRTLKPRPWWRQPAVIAAPALALFLGLLWLGIRGLWKVPFQIYKLASDHPVSIAGDKNVLWVADWSQQSLTELRVQGSYLSIVEVHRLADFQPVAVAAAPFYLYSASSDGKLRRHRRDETLSVVAVVSAPGPAPAGLAWDGERLWSCDSFTGDIYEHDARLEVKSSFESPAEKPVGLAWENRALWVADGNTRALWKLSREGVEWKREGPLPLGVFSHNRTLNLSGFTVWDSAAWIVSETGGVLVEHTLPKRKVK